MTRIINPFRSSTGYTEFVGPVDGHTQFEILQGKGLKLGIATGGRQEFGNETELYPKRHNAVPVLTAQQRDTLVLF